MRSTILIITILALSPLGYSTTWYVPDDFTTIQGAISDTFVMNGDTVIVRPGTYVENIDFIGKAITVKSESGPQVTIVDGNQSGSVAQFISNEGLNSVLAGFTLTNGSGRSGGIGNFISGGGVCCFPTSSPTICDNVIVANSAELGGGIFSDGFPWGDSPLITGNTISGNYASYKGGGIHCYYCSATIENNNIKDNTCDGFGGGVSLRASDLLITGNTISGNHASVLGGGIHYAIASPIIENNTIKDNTCDGNGGGIQLNDGSSGLIIGNVIFQNAAGSDKGGGGIYCWDASPTIAENLISQNTALYSGGVYCGLQTPTVMNNIITKNSVTSFGGGMYCYGSNAVVTGNTISDNTAYNGGGGIWSAIGDLSTITKNIIRDNITQKVDGWGGAGIGVLQSTPVISNCILSGNTSSGPGGAITLGDGSNALIVNSTVFGNRANGMFGGGVYCRSSEATISNTVLWSNNATFGPEIWIGSDPSTVTIRYSDVEGGQSSVHVLPNCFLHWGPGMIDADPLFLDRANDDFHLTYSSPCRNTGNNSDVTTTHDFEGDQRISHGIVDMGADEFHTHFYITGDMTPGGAIQGKFVGLPGTNPVGLFIGSGVLPSPVKTMWGEFWLQPPLILFYPLGNIPSDGVMVITFTLPGSIPAPYDVPMQALIGLNPDSLTNLFVLQVK